MSNDSLAMAARCATSLSTLGQGRSDVLQETCHIGGSEASSHRAAEWFIQLPLCTQHNPGVFQWRQFFADPTHWWDNQPVWVDTGMKRSSDSVWISGQEGFGGIRALGDDFRKVSANEHAVDSVDALSLLVKRGCRVQIGVLYRMLKRSTALKDLAQGRHIHALAVKSGYEGHTFLATHLIGLYASHGRLEEAMRVFAKVSTPDAHNWAAIIFAYARKGEPMQAIQLYQQMRESSVKPDNPVFIAVMKACARAGNLAAGKDVHAHFLADARRPDIFVQTCLVDMYAKCGSIDDARRVFDRLPHRNVVTWTAMIAGYAQQGMGQEALSIYRAMQQEGVTPPDSITFVCLLQACASVGEVALGQGQHLHAQIEQRGLQDDVVVGGSLVNMYAKCNSIQEAWREFSRLPVRNVVTWSAMIAGFARQGMGREALALYGAMYLEGITPAESATFVCLLQACADVGEEALRQGQQLHKLIDGKGLQFDVVVGGSLVNMYAKCGSIESARGVFDRLPHRNVVTWTAMISGYAQQQMGQEALSLYSRMGQEFITALDSVTFVCLLQSCALIGEVALEQGKQLHAQTEEQGLQHDVVVGASLVNMYSKCGSIEDARRVFDRLLCRNVVTWTAMISGYVQQGMGEEALNLYGTMQQEGITLLGSVTFVCLLQACAIVGVTVLHQGKQLHAEIETRGLQDNVVVGGSLVNMYAKCGSLEDSRRVFDRLTQRNVATWNTMIGGYAQQGMGLEALSLYSSMQQEEPNSVTFMALLQACAVVGVEALQQGKLLHLQIEERSLEDHVGVGGSLVNMYAKCGSIEDARRVFDRLPHKNVLTWTAMIAGYAQQGMGQEALSVYSIMQQEGITSPDTVMYACLLQACATLAALPLGKQFHAEIAQQGLQGDVVVGTGLVDMYAKCGSMVDAKQVFDSLSERNVEAWSALIAGYAYQGDSGVVFNLVDRMREEGVQPNAITFLSVLTVCGHAGLVSEGRKYFEAMTTHYGITPFIEHYVCMLDLLGRAGYLDEALVMAKAMPFQPNGAVWRTLLGACRKWSDVVSGRLAFEYAVRLDETDASAYILMSNIYAGAQMWEDAQELKARRVKSKAWKQPGTSWWIDISGVHTFVAGNWKLPES